MNFRSVSDLARLTREQAHKIPGDIDLVVGIPRSGVLAASLIALHTNLKLTALDSFMQNSPLLTGHTRTARVFELANPHEATHILLVDDSASTGGSMHAAVKVIKSSGYSGRITTCVADLAPGWTGIDVHFEVVPHSRIFEWNMMHRDFLAECCVDLDGVLCRDPTHDENDDGPRYRHFLETATPMLVPSYKIGRIVTSRLEKYRPQTTQWLQRHGVEYASLDMLDLPDAETRRRLGIHASFKASVYASHGNMKLFLESDPSQAKEIARQSGKPSLSLSTNELFRPGITLAYTRQASRRWLAKGARLVRRIAGRWLPRT